METDRPENPIKVRGDKKDLPRTGGGFVERRFSGEKRTLPIVAQATFLDEDDETVRMGVEFQANTRRRGLHKLQPIEESLRQASEGYQDPKTLQKARKQLAAIVRNSTIAKLSKRKAR